MSQVTHSVALGMCDREAPEPIPKAVFQVVEDFSIVKRSLGRMQILLDLDNAPW